MHPSLALALGIALGASLLAGSGRGQASDATRVEAFVLEQVDALEAADPWALLGGMPSTPPEEVGLLLWRRSPGASGPVLEWDLRFSERETRLLEVERGDALAPSLVYREMQPHSGRTLSADWIEEGSALRVREWSGRHGQHVRLDDCAGGRFRLGLLEELRTTQAPPRGARVFDPLARRFEHLTFALEAGAEDGPWAGTRLLRLTREDGSCAGTWLLRGADVLGFQWQAGGLRARRIEVDDYTRRITALEARRARTAESSDAAPADG